MKKILPNIYQLTLGAVNAYLVDVGPLILIDTGYQGNEDTIETFIQSLGRKVEDIKHIIITHHHPDHAGSLAALKAKCGAKVYMHEIDARLVTQGNGMRQKVQAAPGLINYIIFNFFVKRTPTQYPEAIVDYHLKEGDVLELGEGFEVFHFPGHSAGQIALRYRAHGGFLFVADVAVNIMGLGYPPLFEDKEQGIRDLKRISTLNFEGAAFGHGNPILKGASERFRKKYLS